MKSRTLVGCLSDLFPSVSVFGRFQALEAQEIWIYLNKSMILMPNVNKTWNILKHYSNNLHLQNWNMRMCIKHWHYLTVSFTESLSQHSDPHFLSDTPALRRGATILIHIHVHVYLITYIYILFISMYINIMPIFFLNMHIYIYIYITHHGPTGHSLRITWAPYGTSPEIRRPKTTILISTKTCHQITGGTTSFSNGDRRISEPSTVLQ